MSFKDFFFEQTEIQKLASPKLELAQRLHQGKARTRILRGECRSKADNAFG